MNSIIQWLENLLAHLRHHNDPVNNPKPPVPLPGLPGDRQPPPILPDPPINQAPTQTPPINQAPAGSPAANASNPTLAWLASGDPQGGNSSGAGAGAGAGAGGSTAGPGSEPPPGFFVWDRPGLVLSQTFGPTPTTFSYTPPDGYMGNVNHVCLQRPGSPDYIPNLRIWESTTPGGDAISEYHGAWSTGGTMPTPQIAPTAGVTYYFNVTCDPPAFFGVQQVHS